MGTGGVSTSRALSQDTEMATGARDPRETKFCQVAAMQQEAVQGGWEGRDCSCPALQEPQSSPGYAEGLWSSLALLCLTWLMISWAGRGHSRAQDRTSPAASAYTAHTAGPFPQPWHSCHGNATSGAASMGLGCNSSPEDALNPALLGLPSSKKWLQWTQLCLSAEMCLHPKAKAGDWNLALGPCGTISS